MLTPLMKGPLHFTPRISWKNDVPQSGLSKCGSFVLRIKSVSCLVKPNVSVKSKYRESTSLYADNINMRLPVLVLLFTRMLSSPLARVMRIVSVSVIVMLFWAVSTKLHSQYVLLNNMQLLSSHADSIIKHKTNSNNLLNMVFVSFATVSRNQFTQKSSNKQLCAQHHHRKSNIESWRICY